MSPRTELPFASRDNLEVMAESVETLCTVEMTRMGPGRGIVRPLYERARDTQGGYPTLRAAQGLRGALTPGRVVILSTGVVVPGHMRQGETDGPPGVAALALTLSAAVDARPLILCEDDVQGPLRAACTAMGLALTGVEDLGQRPLAVAVSAFPESQADATAAARRILDDVRPAAVIMAEKLGVNRAGVPHTSSGLRLEGPRAPMEVLVDASRARETLTIGVGDNGNEIGFGMISDAVVQYKPYGRTCRCECGQGIACVNACDHLIVATVSNWGCYGLAAMLAALAGRPELIPDGERIRRAVEACVEAGAVDGATGRRETAVDGIPVEVEACIVSMLRVIVAMGLAASPPRPF